MLFDKMSDFLKECNDTYRVMTREKELKKLEDNECKKLVALVSKTR